MCDMNLFIIKKNKNTMFAKTIYTDFFSLLHSKRKFRRDLK